MGFTRYSRQTILPEVGTEGQQRLAESRILCVGVGGLGSPAALYLAAAGVGRLGLIDGDRVDATNLQRQILFADTDLGQLKVDAGRNRLASLNPGVDIITHDERLTASNASQIFEGYDIVLDGSDNFETKFLVNDAAYKRGIPMVYGAVNGFEGQIALFWGNRGSCYRCLHSMPPKAVIRNCAEAGVLGAVAGTIGTMQATLALQYIISGSDPIHPLYPRLGSLTVHSFTSPWRTISFDVTKRNSCPTCAMPPDSVQLQYTAPVCESTETLTSTELTALLDRAPDNVLIVDVRTEEEWACGRIPTAIHWPLARFIDGELPAVHPHNTVVVLYCKSGIRSARAANIMLSNGIRTVRNLSGGIDAWTRPLSHT